MTSDEVKKLQAGDVISFHAAADVHFRGQIDTSDSVTRFHRVQWLDGTKPRPYDVIDKRSPIWQRITKR